MRCFFPPQWDEDDQGGWLDGPPLPLPIRGSWWKPIKPLPPTPRSSNPPGSLGRCSSLSRTAKHKTALSSHVCCSPSWRLYSVWRSLINVALGALIGSSLWNFKTGSRLTQSNNVITTSCHGFSLDCPIDPFSPTLSSTSCFILQFPQTLWHATLSFFKTTGSMCTNFLAASEGLF